MGRLLVSERDTTERFDLQDEELRVTHIPVAMQQWEVVAVEQEPGEEEEEEEEEEVVVEVGLAWWDFKYLQTRTLL